MGNVTDTKDKFAIIGLGCRMPPAATSLDGFWRFLMRGGNALKPIRKDRWDVRQFHDDDQSRPGKSYAPKAASLDMDVRQFDPLVFGISPREAACMDPQQRLLLESTWEAFEDAGIPIQTMSGSRTGVFIGAFCLDHLIMQMRPSNRHLLNGNSPAGATMTVLSNRISHVFNLRGPSLTLDTACSSSLVALHYACQSLRAGECEMVLAGGVNVMTCPDNPIMMSKGHFLSHHGECHTFAETAAGYARGEGAGVFLIKPLAAAIEAGDAIHAVIRGSGVNQDGHTDGISLPNSVAQEELMREVYDRSALLPGEVDYVEAHGTGTQAGDPAEARALNAIFSQGREPSRKLVVGSVKSNVGHLEAAAGVAGVLKVIGILKNRQVPKNLHSEKPNPNIPFDQYCLRVADKNVPLPSPDEKATLYVGVNSFGYGGTNAHVVLESAPPAAEAKSAEGSPVSRVIPISARSEQSLRDLAGKIAFQAGQNPPPSLDDIAYSTAFRRSHLEYRCAAVAGDLEKFKEELVAISTGQPHPEVVMSNGSVGNPGNLAFVFTGMGPQWWAMGQELIRSEKIVSETVDEIDALFQPLSGWSLRQAMLAGESSSRMEHTDLAQPANFALQVSLARMWESFGIRPFAVVGHSVGEVASAYAAGVYTLEDAVKISFHRSRLQQTMAGKGAMLAVGLPEADATLLLANFPGVSVAAVNSFHATTLSGDAEQLRELAAALERDGVFQKFLRVEVAYHSPQMDPLRDELLAALADIKPRPAQMALYSTAFGKAVPSERWDAGYWWTNVRQPVHFANAMERMFEDGFSSFLEIGPHPVLGNSIKECAAELGRKISVHFSLRRKEPERLRMLLALGELYCTGVDPDWSGVAPSSGRRLPTPSYPWQRQRLWLESEESEMDRLGLPGPVYLNRSLFSPQPGWEVEINRNYFPFLFDHGVEDQTVFAGMGYVEAAITLGIRIHEAQSLILENVAFEKVLIVDTEKLQYLVTSYDAETGRFSISSRVVGEPGEVQRHCRGRIFAQSAPHLETLDLGGLKAGCPQRVDIESFYERLQSRGLHYGETFRPTREVFVGDDCFFLKLDGSKVARDEDHLLHPTLFDAAIQPVLYCAKGERLFVPFSVEQFRYHSRPSSECFVFGRLTSQSGTMIVADVWLLGPKGEIHAQASQISCQVIETSRAAEEPEMFYTWEWVAAGLQAAHPASGEGILLLSDPEDSDLELAEAVETLLPGCSRAASLAPEVAPSRLLVLWGTALPRESAGSLSLKAIGLLQLAAERGIADVTFVTRGARSLDDSRVNVSASPLGAIGLVAQNESQSLVCRAIDLSPNHLADDAKNIVAELSASAAGDIAYRNGIRFECTLKPRNLSGEKKLRAVSVEEPIALSIDGAGKVSSLVYEPVERRAPGEGEVEIRVHRTALNYKDLLKIDGRIHPLALEGTFNGAQFGMECSGVIERAGPGSSFQPGDKVVTLVRSGFRTHATVPETFVIPIPQNLGMEAAAIPVVYMAAYRGLVEVARLQPGERILIHHATGGLGLAAIEIARWVGAEIFATAGSGEKRKALGEMGIRHVYSSRTLDFEQEIRRQTKGGGVDVVIGAQVGQAMHASFDLLRSGGRYIEVGKKDIAEDNGLPMRAFHRNLIFAAVDMDRMTEERPALVRELLKKIFAHFEAGDFSMAPAKTFPVAETREAFEEMARSRHIGKLLIDFSQGTIDIAPGVPPPVVRKDGSYLVTGGTSGFGIVTARWLAAQGAGRVILASRSGPNAPGIQQVVEEISAAGASVDVISLDVADPAQVTNLLASLDSGPLPLRGIIHGAMVLSDAMLADVNEENFNRIFQPKAVGALNIASAIGDRRDLDFVVFYSSVSAMVGNRGQASYVAANSILDALAHDLRARGIPATSINWGALAESGVVARDHRIESVLAASGITGLTNRDALSALEKTLRAQLPQIGVFDVDWSRWHEANPTMSEDPRFREMRIRAEAGEGGGAAADIRKLLAEASKEQRLKALEEHLQEVLASILKMPRESVPTGKRINELGVDSLMVLELGLGIKDRIGVNFSAMEFLKGPNLQQLAAMAETKLWSN